MINLMYVVLMALLALNVSTEVLDGFSVVEESLNRTTDNASRENKALYEDFRGQMERNPAKVKAWFDKATAVKDMSDSLYDLAQALKVAVAVSCVMPLILIVSGLSPWWAMSAPRS